MVDYFQLICLIALLNLHCCGFEVEYFHCWSCMVCMVEVLQVELLKWPHCWSCTGRITKMVASLKLYHLNFEAVLLQLSKICGFICWLFVVSTAAVSLLTLLKFYKPNWRCSVRIVEVVALLKLFCFNCWSCIAGIVESMWLQM